MERDIEAEREQYRKDICNHKTDDILDYLRYMIYRYGYENIINHPNVQTSLNELKRRGYN